MYTVDCGLCIHCGTCGCALPAIDRPLLISSDHLVSMAICNKEHCTVPVILQGMEVWRPWTRLHHLLKSKIGL